MSYMDENPYQATYNGSAQTAAYAQADERADFIRRTYLHLAGAVAAFIAVETLIFAMVPEQTMHNLVGTMTTGWNWLIVIGAFVGVSWIADKWASSATSLNTQYLGLGLFVVAEAVIFVPLLFIASRFGPENAIAMAGLMTAVIFGGLTGLVFVTKAELSGMGKYLALGGIVALGLIVCSILFGFSLGVIFVGFVIALACGYILYQTSNVLHHYQLNQHVAASLALFASVALLFYYILMLFMSSRD